MIKYTHIHALIHANTQMASKSASDRVAGGRSAWPWALPTLAIALCAAAFGAYRHHASKKQVYMSKRFV